MKMIKLSHLCDIQIGKTPSRKTDRYWGKGYPWVSISDLKNKYICNTKEQITAVAVNETNCKEIPVGTLLMSFKLSIGKLAFSKCNLFTNEAIAGLLIKNEKELDKHYLYYALKNIPLLKDANIAAKGRTLNKKSLGNLKIPLPKSINEQIKIANLLTQLELIITKRKESIELLDDLLQSSFLDMFGDPVLNKKGWDKVIISDCCLEVVDCINKTAPTVDYETDYKMIRTTNIRNYKVSLEETKKVDAETYKQWIRRLKPKRHDIVFTREAPVGEAGIILSDDNVFLGQRTMLYRVNEEIINVYYLLFELMGSNVQQQVKKLSIGSNVKHLSVPACKNFKINLPPKPLQDKFATIVQKVEYSKEKYQKSLDELQELFESLSQRAFKGELDLSKLELPQTQNEDNVLQKIIDTQKVYESNLMHVDTISISSIPKENLGTYIFELIKLDNFSIEDIQHNFKTDFTYDEVKKEVFQMLEDGKIKQVIDEYVDTESLEKKYIQEVKLVVV